MTESVANVTTTTTVKSISTASHALPVCSLLSTPSASGISSISSGISTNLPVPSYLAATSAAGSPLQQMQNMQQMQNQHMQQQQPMMSATIQPAMAGTQSNMLNMPTMHTSNFPNMANNILQGIYPSPPPYTGGYQPQNFEVMNMLAQMAAGMSHMQQLPQPNFEEDQELETEEDAFALPYSILGVEPKKTELRDDLAQQLGAAAKVDATIGKELLLSTVKLVGLPNNEVLKFIVPTLETRFVTSLPTEALKMDRMMERFQREMWQSIQPSVRSIPKLQKSSTKQATTLISYLQSGALSQCGIIADISRQRRSLVMKNTSLDCKALTGLHIPLGQETLFGGLAKLCSGTRQRQPGKNYLSMALSNKGLSQGVISTISSARRVSTSVQYERYQKRFIEFAINLGKDPFSNSDIATPLEFLQMLKDEKLNPKHGNELRGYSCIRIAASALSAILTIENLTFGEHPLTKAFMKGLKNERPVTHRYLRQWDPQIVLEFFKTRPWQPARSMALDKLARKTLVLILLTSVKRVHSVPALCITADKMSKTGTSLNFHIDKVDLKEGSRGQAPPKPITLKSFMLKSVCPVNYVQTYIERTAKIRGDIPQLFITTKGPVRPISQSTAKRWVREVLREAGIDIQEFGPGSCRGASSSKGSDFGASLEEILACGGWTRASTWQKHYNRPIMKENRTMSQVYFK